MTTRARAIKRRLFPERQIYFRSNGRVRFVVLSPRVQIALTTLVFCLSAWIGVSSANLFFEDRIIAAKNQRLDEMSERFENLNSQIRHLEQSVLSKARRIEDRQRFLDTLMDEVLPASARPKTLKTLSRPDASPARSETPATPRDKISLHRGITSRIGQTVAVMTGGAWNDFEEPAVRLEISPTVETRLAALAQHQDALVNRLLALTEARIASLEKSIKITGLTGDKLLSAAKGPAGSGTTASIGPFLAQGGPFIAAGKAGKDVTLQRPAAPSIQVPYYRLINRFNRLRDLNAAVDSAPWLLPVPQTADYYFSSGFGRRTDPIRKVPAWHRALDIAGHWKTPILATAPGVVSFAGRNGPYGKMVEINHGHGFKTRYGHLARILVKKGDVVTARQRIGLMGNSGRSTGTHLHYEVRFNNIPRNPMKFLRAAKHVFKNNQI
jgi:murein DD-endopeptidase MepM/ murein hydrolase activator NlpD